MSGDDDEERKGQPSLTKPKRQGSRSSLSEGPDLETPKTRKKRRKVDSIAVPSDDDEGDADLTVGIIAKHQERLKNDDNLAEKGIKDTKSLDRVAALRQEDDGGSEGTSSGSGKKKKKKKKSDIGAVDSLEKDDNEVQKEDASPQAVKKLKLKRPAFREEEGQEPGEIQGGGEQQEDFAPLLWKGLRSTPKAALDTSTVIISKEAAQVSVGKEKVRKVSTLESPDASPPRAAGGAEALAEVAADGNTLAMRKLLRGARYFDPPDEQGQRCFNCGQEGHMSRNCPEGERDRPCFVCGKYGHKGADCPTGTRCFVCHKQGHRARDCPEKGRRGAIERVVEEGEVCLKCGRGGHTRAECTRSYDPADLELISCYICGRLGHLSCVDLIDGGPEVVSCYSCGEKGHIGGDCSRARRNGEAEMGGPEMICFRCGGSGHMARNCNNSVGGSNGGGARTEMACYRCGGVGHMARECPGVDTRQYDRIQEGDFETYRAYQSDRWRGELSRRNGYEYDGYYREASGHSSGYQSRSRTVPTWEDSPPGYGYRRGEGGGRYGRVDDARWELEAVREGKRSRHTGKEDEAWYAYKEEKYSSRGSSRSSHKRF